MNKYEIIDTIGEGQYGVVLKARNKQTSEFVAIKKFKEDDSDDQNKRVILRQVKILKSMSHQNIIELKQAFRKKGKIYLVCQFVDRNLLEIVQQSPPHPQKIRQYVYQLLRGLAYMHSLNIIHRDIKPQNVLIGKHDEVKICDLGFARTMPSNGIMTDYVATRWYRPPELLIGRDDYDKSIDLWSVACVMAEMVDGQPLFGGQNDLDQLYLIQKCLGPLNPQQMQQFLKNPKFIGMKFPEITSLQSIEKRYFGKFDKYGIDLLKKMLVMDPKSRITAEKALQHPYFQRMSSLSDYQFKKNKQQHIKPNAVPINNFLQDHKVDFKQSKGNKIKDDKAGKNKVTGLIKVNKNPSSNEESPWIFNKGKSLTKKSQQGTSMAPNYKQKTVASQQKYGKSYVNKNLRPQNLDDDYYYDQHWQQQAKNAVKRQQFPTDQGKKKKWNFKKDNNINIIFNNNTYNLNIVDDPHYK